jgi:ethanolamine ammonia-lyase large subunit
MIHRIPRKEFLVQMGILGTSALLFNACGLSTGNLSAKGNVAPMIDQPREAEDIFSYIQRIKGGNDLTLYRQIVGAANEFKEGDLTLGIAAESEQSRHNARTLLSNTKISALKKHSLYTDELYELIENTTSKHEGLDDWTVGELKTFILSKPEPEIKAIMPALTSDVIACVVKLMSNDELVQVGQKVFNPLPGTQIGSKGYMSARVQPGKSSMLGPMQSVIWSWGPIQSRAIPNQSPR